MQLTSEQINKDFSYLMKDDYYNKSQTQSLEYKSLYFLNDSFQVFKYSDTIQALMYEPYILIFKKINK